MSYVCLLMCVCVCVLFFYHEDHRVSLSHSVIASIHSGCGCDCGCDYQALTCPGLRRTHSSILRPPVRVLPELISHEKKDSKER